MTGETVELAIEAGCRDLGIETHEAQFEIIDMPVKKTLGLFGGNPAKVRVYLETSPVDVAAEYLRSVLRAMDAPMVDVIHEETESGATLTINGEGLGFIIGRHGDTLDALQYLTGLVANHVDNSYYRITLNMGNYREKREKTLESLAAKMAGKALKYGRNQRLEPMNPYERRIIHTAVQSVEGVKSWSEGSDMNRHVIIGPEAGERAFTPRGKDRRDSGGGYRGGNNRDRRFDNRSDGRSGDGRPGSGSQGRPANATKASLPPSPSVARSASSSVPPAAALASSTEFHTKSKVELGSGPLYGRIDVKK